METVSDTGFDFADIVDDAVSRCGGETATAADIQKVRRGLRVLTERWAAEGFNTWRIRSMVVPVVAGTTHVELPDCVDDVVQVTAAAQGSGSESSMRRIGPSEYMQLTKKVTKGRPSQWWLAREDCPKLYIYPTGSDSGSELTVFYVERPAAFDRYSFEDDVPGRWLEALTIGAALEYAKRKAPLDEGLISRLSTELMQAEGLAQRNDRDRSRYTYRI